MKAGDLIAGRYRLLRRIGAGAMSTVWAARHEVLNQDFAIKITDIGPYGGLDRRERLVREAQTVARLRHPNIVQIVDAGDVGQGGLYLTMELLEGGSLADRIRSSGKLGPAETVALATEVCRGLRAAHAAGVLHRDIKPENILLAKGPTGGVVPKLLDFGVSSTLGPPANESQSLAGTPAYMSPEQALGEEVGPRSDLWSLGVVMYEMLTGQLPFVAKSYPALLPLIIEAPHPALPASVPEMVQRLVGCCLAKDPEARYPNAEALLEALVGARAALSSSSEAGTSSPSVFFVETGNGNRPPATLGTKRRSRVGGHAVAMALVGTVVGLLLLAGLFRSSGGGRLRTAAQQPPGEEPSSAPPRCVAVMVAASTTPSATAAATGSSVAHGSPIRDDGAASGPKPHGVPGAAATTGHVEVVRGEGRRTGRPVTTVNSAGF